MSMIDCEAIILTKTTLASSLKVKGNLATYVKGVDLKDLQLDHLYILNNTYYLFVMIVMKSMLL